MAAKLSASVGTIVMADMKDEARPDMVIEPTPEKVEKEEEPE